jgi:endonuclease/exonuclease/phosphatase family metal-dependent hydrolase
VSVPVTLGAGQQQMTLLFDTGGFNVASINVVSASSTTPPTSGGSLPAMPTTTAVNGQVGVTVSPTLSWQSAGATAFDLRFSASNPPASFATGVTRTYYEASGLSLGTKYYWQVIAKNAAGSTAGPVWSFATEGATIPPPPPPPPPPGTASFVDTVIADWNIQVNDSSAGHAQSVIDALMALSPRPQIIVLEEAYAFHYSTYVNELAARTGQTWQGVFQTHCPSGAWNGSSCTRGEDEGVGIFTSFPVINSSVMYLPYADCYHSARAAARLGVSVGGIPVQVFGTHLQTGSCTNVVAARAGSMSLLKSWASNFSVPQLAAGDFNAGPDEVNTTQGMKPNFVDTWTLVGSAGGFTAFAPNPTMKIDFVFADASTRAQPLWTLVPTTTGAISDHRPVHAGLRIFR